MCVCVCVCVHARVRGSAVVLLSPLGKSLHACADMMIYVYEGEMSCVGICVCARVY